MTPSASRGSDHPEGKHQSRLSQSDPELSMLSPDLPSYLVSSHLQSIPPPPFPIDHQRYPSEDQRRHHDHSCPEYVIRRIWTIGSKQHQRGFHDKKRGQACNIQHPLSHLSLHYPLLSEHTHLRGFVELVDDRFSMPFDEYLGQGSSPATYPALSTLADKRPATPRPRSSTTSVP